MTNEQREAVEFLEFYKQHCLKIEIENMDNYETVHDGDFVSKNLDTVLSLLKENSAEIQQKNTELAEKSAEIEKKDKIIEFYKKGLEREIEENRENVMEIIEKDKEIVASVENLAMSIEENNWFLPTKRINYCPMCGRRLGE